MNDLNEIVVSFENDKNHNYIQQTHSEENSNKDKISDESQITYVLFHFYENLGKRFYKKTIKEIDSLLNGQNIDEFNRAWKIHILRIRARLKVIKKKIEKYLIHHAEKMKFKYEVNSIKRYLNQVLDNLNIFVQKFSNSKQEEEIEKVDNLLYCYFEYIYLYCLFNKKLGNIIAIIPYLSYFLSLYNETKLIYKSDSTLFQLEKCFLLLIQTLISNKDYISSINNIDISTKICLNHIIYNIKDFSDGVFIDDKKKSLIIKNKENIILNKNFQEMEIEKAYGDKNIKRILFNLIILFYYRGICYENIGKINFSIKSYYQSLWFINNFFYHSASKMSLLFKNTLERSLEVKRAIDYIIRRINFYERMQYFLKRQLDKKKSEEENKDIMYDHLLNGIRLKNLENKLLKLNINEVDTVNRFDVKKNVKDINGRKREGIYKNIFMSDTRLLNSYLREDFRHIIDSMDKIKTLNIDLATRDKIQKYLRGIYFDKSLKKLKQKNKIKNMKMKTNSTPNITKNIKGKSNIILIKENKSGLLKKNNSTPNTFRLIRNNINKKEIPTPTTKRRVFLSNKTLKFTEIPTCKNFSESLLPQTTNKTNRPKSSMSVRRQISYDTQDIKRVFTPITTSRNNLNYKNKTIVTPMDKQKNKIQRLYSMKKGNKTPRAQSAKLFKKIPTEDKKLNKFFNKKYLRKRNYIKMLEDRDIKFQKCILKIKKEQKPKNDIYTKETMKQNANELFQRVMGLYLISNTNMNNNKTPNIDKKSRLDEKLRDALVSSLDNAAIRKYNIQKDIERNKRRPMTEQMSLSLKNINEINKNIIKDIDNKLEEIKQREIIEIKNYQRTINNKYIKKREEDKKDIMINEIKSANTTPSYKKIKGKFSYENYNNKEHYFYSSDKK